MKNQYNKTITACFVGYVVQAIVNNFISLLFLTFQRSFGIPLSQITLLVTFNFGVQLLVDLVSVSFVDKIGYRASMLIAHIMSAAGPSLVGSVSSMAGENLKIGILAAIVFPAVLFLGILYMKKCSGRPT